MEAAYNENQFCTAFSADDIHHLLCGYVEDYQEHLVNLYEPVLLTALGCMIAGTDMSQEGEEYLYRLFADMPVSEIAPLIQNTTAKLVNFLKCSEGLTGYIQNSLPLIGSKIATAAQEQTLSRVFVLPDYPENKPIIMLSFGDKMDDEQYRRIVVEISECRFPADKAAVIKSSVHSFADLEDILLISSQHCHKSRKGLLNRQVK